MKRGQRYSIRKRRYIFYIVAFILLPAGAVEMKAQSIQGGITSNGGERQEGAFGTLYSTIGEPLASDSLSANLSGEEITWTGFWQVQPLPTSGAVEEVWGRGRVEQAAIAGIQPNPFSSELHVELAVPSTGHLVLAVHDLLGGEVVRLVDGRREAGTAQIAWIPEGLEAGTYILRLSIDGRPQAVQTVQYFK